MRQIDFNDLHTRETPREILETDFPKLGSLPIKGGWGYDQVSACVIDKNDPVVDPTIPFNGVALEYIFAEYRLYEELIVFRTNGKKFAGINRELMSQKLLSLDGRSYDLLTFQVSAFLEHDFNLLKSRYQGPNGVSNPNFDFNAHQILHNSMLHTGTREYWFDITSFYVI